jgi:tetrahedral aminopeptidase
VVFVASVQEEVGTRGAITGSYNANPDYGFAIDVTFATDYPNVGEAKIFQNDIKLGDGPVIARGPNIDDKLYRLLKNTADEHHVDVQYNTWAGATGTDARSIQINRGGVPTALVSIPLRYMHSPNETCSLDDLDKLINLLIYTIYNIPSKI